MPGESFDPSPVSDVAWIFILVDDDDNLHVTDFEDESMLTGFLTEREAVTFIRLQALTGMRPFRVAIDRLAQLCAASGLNGYAVRAKNGDWKTGNVLTLEANSRLFLIVWGKPDGTISIHSTQFDDEPKPFLAAFQSAEDAERRKSENIELADWRVVSIGESFLRQYCSDAVGGYAVRQESGAWAICYVPEPDPR